jgi:hypothetical protein
MRNPFGVMDVPDPDDEEVMQFAGSTTLEESADDENAKPWCTADNGIQHDMVEAIGRAAGTAARTPPYRAMPRINGNRAEPKRE